MTSHCVSFQVVRMEKVSKLLKGKNKKPLERVLYRLGKALRLKCPSITIHVFRPLRD